MKKSLWVLITIICMIITGGTVHLASSFKTSEQKAAEASPPPPSILTAGVEYRSLETTQALTCSVDFTDQRELNISNPTAGAQYTSVDIVKDERLTQGTLVAEVNGEPIFILLGGFSFYRDLSLNDQGPDAQLLNDSLVALGYQAPRLGSDRSIITVETYRALGLLYKGFGYPGPAEDQPIKSSSFIVLPEAARVISTPRTTGDVSAEPLAILSTGEKALICQPTAGLLNPQVASGMQLRLTAAPETTYTVEITAETSQDKESGSSGLGQTGSQQANKILTVRVPEEKLGELTTFAAELIISTSGQVGLVVPSAALFTQGGENYVIVRDGETEKQVGVAIIYTANGFSIVEPVEGYSLNEGDTLRVQAGQE